MNNKLFFLTWLNIKYINKPLIDIMTFGDKGSLKDKKKER